MSCELVIRPEAEAELVEAFSWYEDRLPGLGYEFLLCVDAALSMILRSPEIYPVILKDAHRALVRRFPYTIFFVVEEARVVVLAIFQMSSSMRSIMTLPNMRPAGR